MPNVRTYNVLINGLCKFGRMNQGYDYFAIMESKGIVANKYTYTILISENCNSGKWDEAFQLYREMLDRGIEPDSFTHSALLKQLCKDYKSIAVRYLEYVVLGSAGTADVKTD